MTAVKGVKTESVICLIKSVCTACFKVKCAFLRMRSARDPVFSASQSGSVHSECD